MSTAKVIVKGRNFILLLDRLKRQNVHVLRVKKINETESIITLKYKDLEKFFAISQNMWYNTLIGLGGYIGFKQKLKKSAFVVIFSLLFLALCYVADGLVLGVDLHGVSGDRAAAVYKIVADCNIKKGKLYKNENFSLLRKKLFQSFDDSDFVTVKKSGNRLIIDIVCSKAPPEQIPLSTTVSAKRSGKITALKVYSGTAVKSVGDYCQTQDVLAEGYYTDKQGVKRQINCLASYTLECVYEKEYLLKTEDEGSLIARALIDGGIEETFVKDCSVTPLLKGEKNIFLVKITYVYQG